MNLLNIIQEIEEIDPEFQERINPRRTAIKNMTSFGSKVALAAMPFAFGSLFKKAYGQKMTTSGAADILNFALTLEYLEYNFYKKAVASGIIPAGASLDSLTKIRDHEMAHVNFLRTGIIAAGATPVAAKTDTDFDFTAGGNFNDVFTNYDTLLAVAQAFEDTGVRAYKGQAPNLMGTPYLTYALNIHSVEARHASHIRQMRSARGVNIKPWITGANDTGVDKVAASFAGEDNLIQGGVNITSLNGVNGKVTVNAATESFDEPLTKDQIVAIVTPFFKKA
jgi:rubrerythrin